MKTLRENIDQVLETIAAACARVQRDPAGVTLVAVSKTNSAAAVLEAVAAGLQHFGENRVEEAGTKIPIVSAQTDKPLTWHMIGNIQSRKAKDLPPLFQVIHSVTSMGLAEKLARAAVAQEKTVDVMIQINISGEESKSGFEAVGWQKNDAVRDQLLQDMRHILTLPGLNVRGLMTMAPIVETMEQVRPFFADLAALRQTLSETLHQPLPELSMGMTDDYPVAIEEGATLVRIGRAIFGERNP